DSYDHHIDVLDHVTLIAAAVPLRGGLGFADGVRPTYHQAIGTLPWRCPLSLPSSPGILPQVRAESCIAPSLSAILRDFDAANSFHSIVGDARQFVRLTSTQLLVGLRPYKDRMDRHTTDRNRHG